MWLLIWHHLVRSKLWSVRFLLPLGFSSIGQSLAMIALLVEHSGLRFRTLHHHHLRCALIIHDLPVTLRLWHHDDISSSLRFSAQILRRFNTTYCLTRRLKAIITISIKNDVRVSILPRTTCIIVLLFWSINLTFCGNNIIIFKFELLLLVWLWWLFARLIIVSFGSWRCAHATIRSEVSSSLWVGVYDERMTGGWMLLGWLLLL